MCRLLGRASRAPMTDADVIGADGCAEFQRLGRLHGDGWGTAWLVDGDDGATLHRLRDPDNPTHSAALTEALVETPARARITHLRFATEGLATQLDNTHPFVADGSRSRTTAASRSGRWGSWSALRSWRRSADRPIRR